VRHPHFFKHCCRAKSAEQRGDLAAAVAELTHAMHLASDTDEQLQLEAWLLRLKTVPTKPAVRNSKPRKQVKV
jgi:hypothetical protein